MLHGKNPLTAEVAEELRRGHKGLRLYLGLLRRAQMTH